MIADSLSPFPHENYISRIAWASASASIRAQARVCTRILLTLFNLLSELVAQSAR